MLAVDLMTQFAERTGLSSGRAPQRYLWTDAFAVCNFLGLARATGESRYTELATSLVDQVHHVLGRHRSDDARRGWISGLAAADGEAHPTLGGLRIGKPEPERAPHEPLVERLEWDRDGQYFHYLTKWMHALDQVARATGQVSYVAQACELADTAHRRFAYGPAGRRRMHWKMSIDLARPLVASMGHHDPLDGYLTFRALEATRRQLAARGPDLSEAIADLRAMIDVHALATTDPLGLGGLLVDAYRLAQLGGDRPLHDAIIAAADRGLQYHASSPERHYPAHHRLAFRELGLSIGLAAASEPDAAPRFARHAALRTEIEAFWSDPGNRQSSTWLDHLNINEVMLATSVLPEGFLVRRPITPPPGRGLDGPGAAGPAPTRG
ncbi:MAG TPA: hypothetical protein VFT22_27550 [Kofleriaceae bacterium]|nr:hypothetical protein [Kofleriaceae bacterium]